MRVYISGKQAARFAAKLGLSIALLWLTAFGFAQPAMQASAAVPDEAVRLPVIMYHAVINEPDRWGTYIISAKELESDMAYLRSNGYEPVLVQDLLDYVNDGKPLPEKPVMLTFDDGCYNNYLYAYPLLKKYDMKAVISIIGKYTDKYTLTVYDDPIYSHITWSQAAEMVDSGLVEIQNHSYDMHKVNQNRSASMRNKGEPMAHYETALIADTIRLQALVDEYTGHIPTAYAYPLGMVSKESVGILKQVGIKCSFISYMGVNKITKDPDCLYLMRRLLRPHGKSVSVLLDHYMK